MITQKEIESLIENITPEYLKSLMAQYENFLVNSDLPRSYYNHRIQEKDLQSKTKILNDNIDNIVTNRYCYGISVQNYTTTGNLVSFLLDSYFKKCITQNLSVEMILYVDTNLLLDDYKKLMDADNMPTSLAHSLDTLTKNIENAPYVFWDRFSLIGSNYEKQKLYNILLIRQRKQLGNLFFIKDAATTIPSICDEELYSVMNMEQIVDFSKEILKLQNKDNGGAKW